MSVRIGKYRQRITFQEKASSQNPLNGGWTAVWHDVWLDSDTPLVDVPAEVLTGPGREFLAAQAEQSETSARINLRWFAGLRTDWRVLWDGRVYNIRSIETDITARLEWRLSVEDGVNEG